METQPSDNPAIPPPLPVLLGVEPETATAPWHLLVTEFPLDATTYHATPDGYSVRSPYRKGTLTLREDGIHLSGVGVVPKSVLKRLAKLFSSLRWLIPMVVILSIFIFSLRYYLTPVLTIFFWVSVASIVICSLLEEYILKSREEIVPWENVIELQCQQGQKWAVLLYADAGLEVGKAIALTLKFGELAPVELLRQGIDHFAPGKTRLGRHVYQWTPLQTIALVIFGTAGVIALLLWLSRGQSFHS